jgi:hypothetical protein
VQPQGMGFPVPLQYKGEIGDKQNDK